MLRLILAALRYRLAATLALGALAMFAVASAAAIPLYASAADRHILASAWAQARPADRSLSVSADVDVVAGVDQAVGKLLSDVRKRAPQEILTETTGAVSRGVAQRPDGSGWFDAPLATRDDFCSHLDLTGACPSAAGEVAISDATAKELGGAGAGSTFFYNLLGVPDPARLTITGIYRPAANPSADPYWAGRTDLTPQPLRAANPIFTRVATFEAAKVEEIVATVDLMLPAPPWPDGALEGLDTDVSGNLHDAGFGVANGLPGLLGEIERARRGLGLSAPLGAFTMLVLCLGTLLLAASQLARRRRSEAAVGMLYGAPGRHRFLLTRGPTLLVLALAAPLGLALGLGLVDLAARHLLDQESVELSTPAFVAGAAALVVAAVAAGFAERGVQSGPVLEALRRVPSRLSRSGMLLELALAVTAIAAAVQALASGFTGLGAAAPILVAAAIGLAASRLVRPLAGLVGRVALERGRLVPGLAAVQLARRSAAGGVVSLAVVCLALIGHAAQAWELSGRDAHDRALKELGAPRVVSVAAMSRPALLAAVRSVDPQGAWAMAVAREPQAGRGELVAVDTVALPSIMDSPAGLRPAANPPGTGNAAGTGDGNVSALRPAANAPITINGTGVVLDVNVKEAVAAMTVNLVLVAPDGAAVTVPVTIPAEAGRHRIQAPVKNCAPGCRLAWLSFPRSPDELELHGIGQAGPDREVLGGAAIAAAARWRSSFELETEVTLSRGADFLALVYRPSDPRHVSRDIRLRPSDAPIPLPVAVSGDPSTMQTDALGQTGLFSSAPRPLEVVWAGRGIPGVPGGGLLADLNYADLLSDTLDNAARLEVWLGDDAPTDALARLEKTGLVVMNVDSIDLRAQRYLLSGNGLGLILLLAAAILGLIVAVLAMLVLSAGDRRSRAGDMRAWLDQGVPSRSVRRVALSGYRMMIVASLPVAFAACLGLWWLGSAGGGFALSPVRVLLPVLLAAAVLVAAGWAADHATDRLARKESSS